MEQWVWFTCESQTEALRCISTMNKPYVVLILMPRQLKVYDVNGWLDTRTLQNVIYLNKLKKQSFNN